MTDRFPLYNIGGVLLTIHDLNPFKSSQLDLNWENYTLIQPVFENCCNMDFIYGWHKLKVMIVNYGGGGGCFIYHHKNNLFVLDSIWA